MEKRGGIAILVKTPGLSPIKTRLARGIGQDRAEAFHRMAAGCVARTVTGLTEPFPVQGYWSVAESDPRVSAMWKALPILSQGPGGFAERLARSYRELLRRHPIGLLVAPDSPHIPSFFLRLALEKLSHTPGFVLGPARDGGFYLLGGNLPVPDPVWEAVPYSVPQTGALMRAALSRLGPVFSLDPLTDVDEPEDLERLRRELQPTAASHPQLAHWLSSLC